MLFTGLFIVTVSLVASYLFTWVIRNHSIRSGFLDIPLGRKNHPRATPLGGGQAMWASFVLTTGAGFLTAWLISRGWQPWWLPTLILNEASDILNKFPQVFLILTSGTCLMVLGWVDDRKDLPAGPKLAAQTAIALLTVLGGISVTAFVPSKMIAGAITVAWIVVVINAFNFLDNMDGLCAGVALVASLVFCAVAVMTGQLFVAMMLVAFIGILGGFLIFNSHPASIFMGDAGSMFVGYTLAILTVVFTFRQGSEPFYGIFTPILILIVPLFDMTYVIMLRIVSRKPISVGDHSHISHRLVNLGMSPILAVITIYLMTLCTALAAVMLRWLGTAGAICAAAQVLVFLTIIFIIEGVGRKT